MARPMSDGVGYFPKDVGFYHDDKIRLVRAEFGAKGMYLLDYILCEIYGKDGYFMKWDAIKCGLVSDGAGCGCTPSFAQELVAGCIRYDVFNKSVFDSYGVLTSAGIQRRYVRMFNGRDYIRLAKEYFVLNVEDKKDVPPGVLEKCTFFSVGTTENSDKSTENPDKSTENNTKKKRINKNISNERDNAPARKDIRRYGRFENVMLTCAEHDQLIETYGKSCGEELIESFSMKLKSKGYKYDDHYSTILLWAQKDGKKPVAEAGHSGSFDTDEFFEMALRRSMG